jgi:hypothetical protein
MVGGTRTLVAVAEAGTHFTCFTGKKVQILTHKAVRDIAAADLSLRELELGAAGVVEIVSELILANAHGRQVVTSLLSLLVIVQKVQILTRGAYSGLQKVQILTAGAYSGAVQHGV